MWSDRLIKPANALRTGYSYLLGRISSHSITTGMPVAAGIEISGLCNLKCPECAAGSGSLTRPGGFMDVDLFRRIISELGPYLYNINLYFQGEPMLHPRFFEFIEISGDIKQTVSTNGHFLSEENSEKLASSRLNRIIISLDGMDTDTYSMYRQGGNFSTVLDGIRNVSEAIRRTKSSLDLEIQFLVSRHNEAQIPLARRFAREVNSALRLKSMQVLKPEDIGQWLPSDERFRRYRRNDHGKFLPKISYGNHCLRLWLNPVITWEGKVVPCCFDKNAEHIMGDLREDSFREIWQGEKYRKFRDSVLRGRQNIEICRNCTSGLYGVAY